MTSNVQKNIAKLVAAGWTHTQIATQLGVDQSTISRYAAGDIPKAIGVASGLAALVLALDARAEQGHD